MNTIHVIECLVEDHGWEAVIDTLTEMAAFEERLEEVDALLDAVIAVNESRGQLLTL